MKFTYEAYTRMLQKIFDYGYRFVNYSYWQDKEKTVILRHDIDQDLQKAVIFSEIEKYSKLEVEATYFVLVSTNFYNVHHKTSRECMKKIIENGGKIGLHFDETQYSIFDEDELRGLVNKEAEILSNIIETKIEAVSMHRPSEKLLSLNLKFPNIINSYGAAYIREMKYLSDSRRYWRENIEQVIENGNYPRLHILTHPFWYMEGLEKDLKQTLKEFVLGASLNYYENLEDNFRDLDNELKRADIERIINK